jgi:hypothetical protein
MSTLFIKVKDIANIDSFHDVRYALLSLLQQQMGMIIRSFFSQIIMPI